MDYRWSFRWSSLFGYVGLLPLEVKSLLVCVGILSISTLGWKVCLGELILGLYELLACWVSSLLQGWWRVFWKISLWQLTTVTIYYQIWTPFFSASMLLHTICPLQFLSVVGFSSSLWWLLISILVPVQFQAIFLLIKVAAMFLYV